MTSDQLRQKYLKFFQSKKHVIIPSASLVPENDPTTLFTGSGMQPLLNYFLGEKHPEGTRVCNSQKCFRSQDIEEIGDNRHTTFFEMLGNWSFGDYFKEEQLSWIWEFLVSEIKLDPKKLLVSVYAGNKKLNILKDQEAISIWTKLFKSQNLDPKKHIFEYGNENWWSRVGEPAKMPAGEPGGPDSEIFYDFGPELKLHENSKYKNQPCHINCDCGRYLEICNSVFMQYVKLENGNFQELPAKNIDFGGGFIRILAAKANNPDVFATDLFINIIKKLENISKQKYSQNKAAFRIIADHVRAAVFLASDGVYPSNKEQGYFARRLLRRSILYGRELNIQNNFLTELVPVVAQTYLNSYPELDNQKAKIKLIFDQEENKFKKAINLGLKKFGKIKILDAQTAFDLYQNYGFPLELSLEEAEKKNIKINKNININFNKLKNQHAEQSRAGAKQKFKGGLGDNSQTAIKYHTATHLLQAALRKILGPQVTQKGSNINNKRLRFDFNFERALSDDEKQAVEKQINNWIKQALPVTSETMSKQDAINNNQILSLFADKYPDQVKVYSIGQKGKYISRELCGGPHVDNIEKIKRIKITREKSASAGIRRLYLELA